MRMGEEIALGAPTCHIARNGYYLNIEIPRRDPTTVRLLSLIPKALHRFTAMPVIGVDEEGTLLLLWLPSPDVGHVLICGTRGSGKTELARTMIASLAMNNHLREVQLILIDPKRRGSPPSLNCLLRLRINLRPGTRLLSCALAAQRHTTIHTGSQQRCCAVSRALLLEGYERPENRWITRCPAGR